MGKRLVRLEEIKGDEILAKDIITSGFKILLGAGSPLMPEYVAKLRELGVKEVYIKDEGALDAKEVVILREETTEGFRTKVKKILEKHTYANNTELEELSQTADNIICDILEEEDVIEKIYDIKERSTDIYEHSISICSLATIISIKLNLDRELVHDIGVACLLHDLGLRYLTIDYADRELEELSDTEQVEYRKHPIYAYSDLRDEPWLSTRTKNMILYHHERMDGSGFPLHAREIPIECSVIQVCDAFDEMICGIGHKRAKVYEAVEYLKMFKGVRFDASIIDIFLEFTAVYPSGSRVRTSDGEIGVVIQQNKQFPDRPILRIIKDSAGNSKDEVKDLVSHTTLFIEEVLEQY